MSEHVVFDLGGVLARICHSWQEALETAGIRGNLAAEPKTPFVSLPEFDQFQANEISLEAYLDALADFVGCPRSRSLEVHNAILIREYDGIGDLIEQLHANGYRTGCLSNTNAPHWEELTGAHRFRGIHEVQNKMASHLVGLNKPSAEIFRCFCETFGSKPSDIVYFDDFQSNVDASRVLGFRSYRIDPTMETVPQMRTILRSEGIRLVS